MTTGELIWERGILRVLAGPGCLDRADEASTAAGSQIRAGVAAVPQAKVGGWGKRVMAASQPWFCGGADGKSGHIEGTSPCGATEREDEEADERCDWRPTVSPSFFEEWDVIHVQRDNLKGLQ
ncbi:hypothetical protein BRADI_1g78805v3 [Brachypodium distachyon]|uniref:Uncharacterized protein n=1 Tax=Brachypodium distachyon TaxID=15368 RepID=I1HB03_BRADI|nr:hypothetical protein BRADI_1g78805v3 [Brachypodium distachyon]